MADPITRRGFLGAGVAVAATAALPSAPSALAGFSQADFPAVVLPDTVVPRVAYAYEVHSDTWDMVRASSPQEAWDEVLNVSCFDLDPSCPRRRYDDKSPCPVETCECHGSNLPAMERRPEFDPFEDIGAVSAEALYVAQWGARCVHCDAANAYQHDEYAEWGTWRVIAGEAVCDECIAHFTPEERASAGLAPLDENGEEVMDSQGLPLELPRPAC